MQQIVIVSVIAAALGLGCATASPESAAPAAPPPDESVEPESPPKPEEPLKTAQGLELDKARKAVAGLEVGALRRDVEKALGEPDRLETSRDAVPLAWTSGGGVTCIYEWTRQDGETIQLLLGFDGDSQGARLSHLYWKRSS